MAKKKMEVSDKRGRGKPRRYGVEVCQVRGFALPPSLLDRLAGASEPKRISQSEIVVAGVEYMLSLTPERRLAIVQRSRLPGGGAD